jgi:maltose O-acetyltransferase
MSKILFKIISKIADWYLKQSVLIQKSNLKYCGKNVNINHKISLVCPEKIEIGDNTLIADYTTIFGVHGVIIGKNCLISVGCGISSLNHQIISKTRTSDGYEFSSPIIIQDNVWLGMNVCVLPGVNIGENSIIGAGSVVTKNVPSNEIWVGNPAKKIKNLLDT